MKSFGKLFLILGLIAVAFVVYAQSWDTLYGKSAIEDQASNIEKISKRIEKTAKEAEDERKKEVEKNTDKKADSDNFENHQTDDQSKKEEVSNSDTNETVSGLLLPSDDNPKVRSPKRKRKREDPFKDVALPTVSSKIGNYESSGLGSQIKSEAYLRKNSKDKTQSKINSQALKASNPKLKQQIPSGEDTSIDINE
jgi:FtsZ-interacting cell division protein ZipA